jgi:hypothetical protein
MRGKIPLMALLLGSGLVLGACGFADSRSPLPEFMRAKEADPPPPEPPPDVKQIVRHELASFFTTNPNPAQVQVSEPHRDVRGQGWTACVRALQLVSATGAPLTAQIYRIVISGGLIVDRRRIDADDNCVSETYEPI